MYKLIMVSILFMGWFTLLTFLINKGDKKCLYKKGF